MDRLAFLIYRFMNNFYVYIYLDARREGEYVYDDLKFDYEPFYIGKGCGDRMFFHLYESANSKSKIRYNKIKKIRTEGFEPLVYKILDNVTEKEALSFESLMIKKIGRKDMKFGPLINLTNGGEGESGYIWTDESKEKLSNSLKKSDKFQESVRSKEKIEKTSNSLKKYYSTHQHVNKGKPKTKEEIQKIKKTMSIIYMIENPNGDVIEIQGTSNVFDYFRELNISLNLKSRFKISPYSIIYGDGSKGYVLVGKKNDFRSVQWDIDRIEKFSTENKGSKNKNVCEYTILCPNKEIIKFIGRNELRNYIDSVNENIKEKISYYSLVDKGSTKEYFLLEKIKVYKKIK